MGLGGRMHAEQHKGLRSEFQDINRMQDFVRNEERIKAAHPGSSAYAYHKESYTLPADQP